MQGVCQAQQHQQSHLAAGGSLEDAPSVTQYPCKVGHGELLCNACVWGWTGMLFGAQAPKQLRREEARHVAVVQLACPACGAQEAAVHYLLVKRPAQGLLAGAPAPLLSQDESLRTGLAPGAAQRFADLQQQHGRLAVTCPSAAQVCGSSPAWHLT